MLELVDKAFKEMNNNLAVADYNSVDKSTARQLEDAINALI